jgi:hypothetical protein
LTLLGYSFVHDLVMDVRTIRLDRHGANVHIPVISKGATEMWIVEHKATRRSAWKQVGGRTFNTEAEAIAYARHFDEDGFLTPDFRVRFIG